MITFSKKRTPSPFLDLMDEFECFKDDGSGVVDALGPPVAALPFEPGQQDKESDPGEARAGPFRLPMVDTIAL